MAHSRFFAALSLVFCLPLLFSACRGEARVDYTELNRRLSKADPAFAFREADLFFQDGTAFYYYSLSSPQDALLTMRQDEDGLLTGLTLTCEGAGAAPPVPFCRLASALCAAYCPQLVLPELETALCLRGEGEVQEHRYYTYRQDGYCIALFRSGTLFWLTAAPGD